eukprot:2805263-Amphidinium_carterae.1
MVHFAVSQTSSPESSSTHTHTHKHARMHECHLDTQTSRCMTKDIATDLEWLRFPSLHSPPAED